MATTSRAPSSTNRGSTGADLLTLTVRSIVAAISVALIGLAIALIVAISVWFVAPHDGGTTPEAVMRIASSGWLLSHHVAIELTTGTLGLVPLGLLVIPASLLYAGARQLALAFSMRSPGEVVRAVIPYALAYGIVVAIVAGLTANGSGEPHALQGFVAGTLLATVCGAYGMLRASDLVDEAWQQLPFEVRQVLAAATAGLAVMIGLSAILVTLALAMGFPEALDMFQALKPDLLGGVILALLAMAFVPNLIVWFAAFSTGIGFTVGVGSSVSPRGIAYGPLPVFPPLAAIPPEGHPGTIAVAALVGPLLAGLVTGFLMHRRLPRHSANVVTGLAVVAGFVVGLGLAILCWLSAGAVAEGQLSQVGPIAWRVGLVASLEVGLVAAAVCWESRRRSWSGYGVQRLGNRFGSAVRRLKSSR